MLRLTMLAALLVGCSTPAEPHCPALYCATTGHAFLWDACQPHPKFETCAECHQPHTPNGMNPIPCTEVTP